MLVVVGGHARNTGKTALAAGLIRRFRECGWTAVKLTPYGHAGCSHTPGRCRCEDGLESGVAISEEYEPGTTDTGRFLAAGAKRSFWLRAPAANVASAAPVLGKILKRNRNVIIESNSALELVAPDLFLMLLDFSNPDFKDSGLRYMDRAHAFVIADRGLTIPLWEELARGVWDRKPHFYVKPPNYVSAAVCGFAGATLGLPSSVC